MLFRSFFAIFFVSFLNNMYRGNIFDKITKNPVIFLTIFCQKKGKQVRWHPFFCHACKITLRFPVFPIFPSLDKNILAHFPANCKDYLAFPSPQPLPVFPLSFCISLLYFYHSFRCFSQKKRPIFVYFLQKLTFFWRPSPNGAPAMY